MDTLEPREKLGSVRRSHRPAAGVFKHSGAGDSLLNSR